MSIRPNPIAPVSASTAAARLRAVLSLSPPKGPALCSTNSPWSSNKRTHDVATAADRIYVISVEYLHDDADETWEDAIKVMESLATPTAEELHTLAHDINRCGQKQIVNWFMNMHPGYLTEADLYRNATLRWWVPRWRSPDINKLNFQAASDGSVVVDLWHTVRGVENQRSFNAFRTKYPTFFFGSMGMVYSHLQDLNEYVPEAEEWEDPRLYVKRGRFRFKPLLWFSDTDISVLRDDVIKSDVVAKLINDHPALAQKKDIRKSTNEKWKFHLYSRWLHDEAHGDGTFAREFRLDNNCVEDAQVPLEAGFQGTLSVDVSGFGGAMNKPGTVKPSSESVVLWDVPNTVVDEGQWEQLEVDV
jgi:hypothetical protein